MEDSISAANQQRTKESPLLNGAYHDGLPPVTEVPLWREALAFYASHIGAVVRVLLPPTTIAYLGALLLQHQADLAQRELIIRGKSVLFTGGLWAYEKLSLPMQLWFVSKQLFIWLCYCFALIGICNLVSDRIGGEDKPGESVFYSIREHPLQFLKAATFFFAVLVLAYAAMMLIMFGMAEIAIRTHVVWNFWYSLIGTMVSLALVLAVLVRWAFAVPLAVLHSLSFGAAMKASDRLTDRSIFPLWSLAMESEITGYLALIAPSYILFYLHLPQSAFTYYGSHATEIFLSAMTQAPLLIGIGLMLARLEKESTLRPGGAPSS